jgi:hypothetical protein
MRTNASREATRRMPGATPSEVHTVCLSPSWHGAATSGVSAAGSAREHRTPVPTCRCCSKHSGEPVGSWRATCPATGGFACQSPTHPGSGAKQALDPGSQWIQRRVLREPHADAGTFGSAVIVEAPAHARDLLACTGSNPPRARSARVRGSSSTSSGYLHPVQFRRPRRSYKWVDLPKTERRVGLHCHVKAFETRT